MSKKIGLLVCGYDCADSFKEVLKPWIQLKEKYNIIISFVHCKFKEYNDINNKDVNVDYDLNGINYFFAPNEPLIEIEVRSLALKPLLDDNVDYIWQLDLDEYYTVENIENIINFIYKDKFIPSYKISFKNYVFDASTYLEEPFTPHRIFKTRLGNFKLNKFIDDNLINYLSDGMVQMDARAIACKIIPPEVAYIKHVTWLNNEKSRQKVEYHKKHFSDGLCSYSWDEKDGLIFNKDFFKLRNLPMPKTLKDN